MMRSKEDGKYEMREPTSAELEEFKNLLWDMYIAGAIDAHTRSRGIKRIDRLTEEAAKNEQPAANPAL